MSIHRLKVTNWAKYNPIKDDKRHWYFKCSNMIFHDPDFFDFTSGEVCVWFYILSLCSQKRTDTIDFDTKYLNFLFRLAEVEQISAIEKLRRHGQLSKIRGRKNSQDNHREEKSIEEKSREEEIPPNPPRGNPDDALREIWNQNSGPLPKVIASSPTRRKNSTARIKEEPDLDVWVSVVKRVADSKFCCGENDRGWQASFDWLIRPDTRLKILEGKYDDRLTAEEKKRKEQAESRAKVAALYKEMGINGNGL